MIRTSILQWLALPLLGLGFAVVAPATPVAAQPSSPAAACDRSCLDAVLDHYLDALANRDPSRIAIDPAAKITENGRSLRIGDGIWKTATGIGSYRIRLIDPRSGQAGFYGVVKAGETSSVFFVRLASPAGRVSEIETIVASDIPPDFAGAAAKLSTARPAFGEELAPGDRVPRDRMIAAANSYYDGIEQARGDVVAFASDCHRIENGIALVNNPGYDYHLVSPEGRSLPNFAAMGCRAQFDTGLWGTDAISHRRFPIVDEKTGVVAAFTLYHSHAKAECAEVKDYGKVCPAGPARADLDLVELFKIRGGEIHEMESAWTVIPIGAGSGW